MSYYLEFAQFLSDVPSKNQFFYASIDGCLRIIRPILSINEIEMLVAVDYNLEELRSLIANFVVSDLGTSGFYPRKGKFS